MLLFPLCGALRNIHAAIDGVNFLLCSDDGDGAPGDGAPGPSDGNQGNQGGSLGQDSGGDTGGGGSADSSDSADDSDPGTTDSISTSALSTQADAQAAMASLAAQLGVNLGTNMADVSSPNAPSLTATLNDAFGNFGPTSVPGVSTNVSPEDAAVNAVMSVATPGLSNAPPTAPPSITGVPAAPTSMDAELGFTETDTGKATIPAQIGVPNLGLFGITAPPPSPTVALGPQIATTATDLADMAVPAPPPTQSLPAITVDAPVATHANVPSTTPGPANTSNPSVNTGVPGPTAADAAAAAAAMGVTGIAAGVDGSLAGAPGAQVASFAVPPNAPYGQQEGLLGQTLAEQQKAIDERDAKLAKETQEEEKPATFDERFSVVPKSLEEQLKDIKDMIDKALAQPDQALTDKDKAAPHAVPAPPSPPISTSNTPGLTAPPAPPSPPISTPNVNFPSPPISTPYGTVGIPPGVIGPQGTIGPAVGTFGAPPSGTLGNPNISMTDPTGMPAAPVSSALAAPPSIAAITGMNNPALGNLSFAPAPPNIGLNVPAPQAPISNAPQNMTIPGTVAAPVPSSLSPPQQSLTQTDMDALAAKALQSPVVAPPPPTMQSLMDAAKQALQQQQNQPPPAPIGRGLNAPVGPPSGVIGPPSAPFGPPATTPGTLGSNITGFAPGSALANIAATVGPVAAEAVSVGVPVSAAIAMQSLYGIPTHA